MPSSAQRQTGEWLYVKLFTPPRNFPAGQAYVKTDTPMLIKQLIFAMWKR